MKKLYIIFLLCSFIGFSQSPGDIVITEIMQNPTTISDNFGEWFEVHNTTGGPIDLSGWFITDEPNTTNRVEITSSVIVPAGGYITLGRGGITDPSDPEFNGGITHAFVYDSSFLMSNGADEVILETPGAVVIDEVFYDGGTDFPDPNGASMSLDPTTLTGGANDIGTNWCEGTSVYDAINNNLGTPGAANDVCAATCALSLTADTASCNSNGAGMMDDTYDVTLDFTGGNVGTTFSVTSDSGVVGGDNPSMIESGTITVAGVTEGTDVVITVDDAISGGGVCSLLTRTITSPACIPAVCASPGDIIITEILQDAGAVSDTVGEWFEVFNTTGVDIDMAGWVLTDSGTNSHTIVPSGGTTIVPAGGYLVLGRSTDMSENGGAPVDYDWTVYTLSNDDDEIIISCLAVEIDRVEYTGAAPWPSPTGSSMELSMSAFNSADNDLGSNWGVATTPFGDGDNGTPGADNDFTLSTNQFDTNNFSVYPNPVTNGILNIKGASTGEIKIRVYDIIGKQVTNTVLKYNETLDVSALKSGIYMLKISQENTSITKKLIIK